MLPPHYLGNWSSCPRGARVYSCKKNTRKCIAKREKKPKNSKNLQLEIFKSKFNSNSNSSPNSKAPTLTTFQLKRLSPVIKQFIETQENPQ